MRSPFMKAAFAFVVGVLAIAPLGLTGCGGSANSHTTPPPQATVSSVAQGALNPASLQVGQTEQAPSCTVTMSDGTTNANCTPSSDTPAVASISATGLITAKATGTAKITAVANADTSKVSAPQTLTVTSGQPVSTITGVSVSCNPSSVPAGGTSQCTSTVTGTGNFSSAVNWSVANSLGSIDASGKYTAPATAGTATIVAASAQDSTKSGSAQVAVTVTTRATPVLQSAIMQGLNWFFCVSDCNKATLGFIIQCNPACKVGDKIDFFGYWPTVVLAAGNVSSDGKTVGIEEPIDATTQASGNLIYFTDEPTDGTAASNTVAMYFRQSVNSAAIGPNGEVSQVYGNVYLWQLTNGKWSVAETFKGGGGPLVYLNNGSQQYFVGGDLTYNLDGSIAAGAQAPTATGTGDDAAGTLACVSVVSNDGVELFAPGVPNAQAIVAAVGSYPYGCAAAVINGTPYAFTASVDGTPMVWKTDASGNNVGSAPLTGFTSVTNIAAGGSGYIAGGWEVRAFKTGASAGVVGILSSYNRLLNIYNGTSNGLPLVKSITVPCALPMNLAVVDVAQGTEEFVVACENLAGLGSYTSFVAYDANGNALPAIKATSAVPPQGFAADAGHLYLLQGTSVIDAPANQ